VTIFDRRSIGPDTIHLYYTSFYLQSRRFHTKHVLIYSYIREKKRIWKGRIRTKCNMMHKLRTKKYKDKVRNDQTSCIQNAFNRDRYNCIYNSYYWVFQSSCIKFVIKWNEEKKKSNNVKGNKIWETWCF